MNTGYSGHGVMAGPGGSECLQSCSRASGRAVNRFDSSELSSKRHNRGDIVGPLALLAICVENDTLVPLCRLPLCVLHSGSTARGSHETSAFGHGRGSDRAGRPVGRGRRGDGYGQARLHHRARCGAPRWWRWRRRGRCSRPSGLPRFRPVSHRRSCTRRITCPPRPQPRPRWRWSMRSTIRRRIPT